MKETNWTVKLVGQGKKALRDLPKDTRESLVALLNEMEKEGPIDIPGQILVN